VKIIHYHKQILLEKGGVARAILDLCTALASAGHEVTLLAADARDAPEPWRRSAPGCPSVVEIRRPCVADGFFTPAAIRGVTRRLRQAEVLHLHGMWDPSHIQVAAAARKLGLPYVYSVHGMLDDWSMAQRRLKKQIYLTLFGRKMLHAAAAVHCTAQAELDQARKWMPRSRGVVIPLIIDVAPFRDLPGPDPARAKFPQLESPLPLALFLSRLHYKKRIELLIHAADRLRRSGRECLVIIAGSGEARYEQQLKDLVSRLQLGDRVVFLGFVTGIEKISLYQAADVFVLPTSQENFGFVLFEALAAATPVVTTRGADTWPELEASGGAVIVDDDPDALANATASILEDPARREAMGHAGRCWVLENLNDQAVVQRYEQLYSEAARGQAP
jgi:glycosyltransferase involved in cell wall biosynthesis